MLVNKRLSAIPTDGIEFAEEIATCLEDYRTDQAGRFDLGLLCTSTKINKWSKNKPVNFESWAALTPMQRKGNAQDESEGYYWGVKMSAGTDHWAAMHDVDFSYRRPYGGSISPFRALDFDGYDHNAVPTMYGYAAGAFYDADRAINVQFDIDVTGWNTTGVDIAEAVWNASLPTEKEQTIGRLYPCILITDGQGKNYAHALYNSISGNMEQLYSRNAWQREWYADLRDCPMVKVPQGDDYRVTIFLVGNALSPINRLNAWKVITDSSMFSDRAFPLPMATGLTMWLKSASAGDYAPVFVGEQHITADDADGFTIYVKTSPAATAANPASVSVVLNRDVVVTHIITNGDAQGFRFDWEDLGMLPLPHNTYSFEAEATCGGLVTRTTYHITAV